MKTGRLLKFALFTRLSIVLLQVLFNVSIPDHNADAFRVPFADESDSGNNLISYLLKGFTRWDGQYFIHVALYGYTHDNTIVFLPVFPLILRGIAFIICTLCPFLSLLNSIVIAGVLLNTLLFCLSAAFLYRLSYVILKSEEIAYLSAILFCINPASIFFSALYSESLFAFLTFGGLLALESENIFSSLFFFSISTAVRSNGLVSFGFIIYNLLKHFLTHQLIIKKHLSKKNLATFVILLIQIILFVLVLALPFAAFQIYCYYLFCTEERQVPDIVIDVLIRKEYTLPSETSEWCFESNVLPYSYIQSQHWNVGFLNYYTWQQIPNFLLALPIFLIVFISSIKYMVTNKHKLWNLSLISREAPRNSNVFIYEICFPYFVHSLALVVFCAFFIHVQVMTRILCASSPVVYWVVSSLLYSNNQGLCNPRYSRRKWFQDMFFLKELFVKSQKLGKILLTYFMLYLVVGTALFVNFLPWT